MLDPLSVVPRERLSALNEVPADPSRDVVLYWQVMARRTRFNFALEYAVAAARAWNRPLVVLEALRAGYPWASDRLHRFALDGMRDNAAAYGAARVAHVRYVEPEPGAGHGLLEALARRACLVVTDEFPEFFLPHMLKAAGRKLADLGVRLEAVDGNGLLPLRVAERAWPTAPHFRRMLQHRLPEHLGWFPAEAPLREARALPPVEGTLSRWLEGVRAKWPNPAEALIGEDAGAAARALAALPIDHGVPAVPFEGGPEKGGRVLAGFLQRKFDTYATRRNEAEDPSNSGLSPYLHWGFVSVHEVFAAIAEREDWTPLRLAPKPTGKREGWWGMGASAEAFLDELVTWRELSYNTAHFVDAHDTYGSLPEWARATLHAHRRDERAELFTRDELEAGGTYDALWNATQGQLRTEGRIHNYLRILWGKKFLEWTREPEEALAFMLHLNNRWALDGRNPNSTAGITWVMGRYDHAWQERPVIGKVRPMSSAATARKIRVTDYVAKYGATLPGRTASHADAGAERGEPPAPRRERKVPRDRGPSRGAGTSNLDVLPE
ncbi:deoxyribodipyrimidine photolyase [Aggregicoccus sp. 17bor-14]|uniref:deoxyribodipyrimidine photolyase n=1 Tax=Myxococcaceae TaxID=31 RepID=UPI00129C668E|nr:MULTISPECIES: deoxyribodipyrimidine photolyase [Myxococcaceae]MBF5042002.1 deoxyribodipyrimidine photolyase [Simulacricoccus sp. 17bor-14]MRI87782.1 deoxyribodipyrimidine photolyase [Aggregicoccus sp. 17bor-14]